MNKLKSIIMNFDVFLNKVSDIIHQELPSFDAHAKMAPEGRMEQFKRLHLESIDAKKAAVMMLFYPKKGDANLALIVRNTYPGVHSSQIGFPGGKVELSDLNLEHTALRETQEEVGVDKEKIQIIRPFSEVYIPPSNFLVHPFLGVSTNEINFVLQEDEVSGIIELPLKLLMDDAIVISSKMTTSYAKEIDVPAFAVEKHIIWGATAMMMSELKETLKRVL